MSATYYAKFVHDLDFLLYSHLMYEKILNFFLILLNIVTVLVEKVVRIKIFVIITFIISNTYLFYYHLIDSIQFTLWSQYNLHSTTARKKSTSY